jgi:hypothetical protein
MIYPSVPIDDVTPEDLHKTFEVGIFAVIAHGNSPGLCRLGLSHRCSERVRPPFV